MADANGKRATSIIVDELEWFDLVTVSGDRLAIGLDLASQADLYASALLDRTGEIIVFDAGWAADLAAVPLGAPMQSYGIFSGLALLSAAPACAATSLMLAPLVPNFPRIARSKRAPDRPRRKPNRLTVSKRVRRKHRRAGSR